MRFLLLACILLFPALAAGMEPSTPSAIDLGIVVHGKPIKWANCNLGASKEYEYGDYYAWGEISSKTDYSWTTYKWANYKRDSLCDSFLTKYNCEKQYGNRGFVDNEFILLPSDDVAHKRLGGTWRIPTRDDIKALVETQTDNRYYWKWDIAKDEQGNEVYDVYGHVIHGFRITYLVTGAELFLPAAGCMGDNQVFCSGTEGFYWSSSLVETFPLKAMSFEFDYSLVEHQYAYRCLGFTIRPVCN